MSVLKNKRSESQLEFYNTATQIRKDLTHFVMNDKIVAKRWKPIFTFPTTDKLIELFDYITAANTISVNPDKFQPVTELLVKEAALLRGWRKADNKFITKFKAT